MYDLPRVELFQQIDGKVQLLFASNFRDLPVQVGLVDKSRRSA